ncbi:MAG: peptidoglycan-binding domain-containing protein, partial [Proteobacteria bacterium]|nr:peptidoglycan-binding domain-containing protein [Pseudomonadota bacterium]
QTDAQRAGTGAAGGGIAGLVLGGPIGLLVGAAAGAGAGTYRDEMLPEADQLMAQGTQTVRQEMNPEMETAQDSGIATRQNLAASNQSMASSRASGSQGAMLTNSEVRTAQTHLRDLGLYPGAIDGVYGPKTASLLGVFQQRQDIPVTMTLNNRTSQALRTQVGSAGGTMPSSAGMSGSNPGMAGQNPQMGNTQNQNVPQAYPQQSRPGNLPSGSTSGTVMGGAGSTSDQSGPQQQPSPSPNTTAR